MAESRTSSLGIKHQLTTFPWVVQWGSHLFGADDSEESGRIGVVGGMGPLDPRQAPNERDLVMEMNVDDDQEEMLDYFNTTFMKNWAGPEHLEVTTRSKGTYVPQLYKHTFYWLNRHHIAADGTSDAPRVRREEAAFTIDSLNPAGQRTVRSGCRVYRDHIAN